MRTVSGKRKLARFWRSTAVASACLALAIQAQELGNVASNGKPATIAAQTNYGPEYNPGG